MDAAAGVVTTQPTPRSSSARSTAPPTAHRPRAAPITPGALADGTPVPLLANLGKPEGAAEAVALGAEGVGLFRTEFLFLSSTRRRPSSSSASRTRKLLAAFPGKKVVVRVLDAGADKPLAFLNDAHEENPALGLRGIRALRASEDILREQLTALAEADAATDADLWVMAPMVATVEETEYFVEIARDYGIKTAGVMVEVPSSALLADRILADADFASIGTNDLTQYTLAADRLLGSVAAFQDPWHPAVLRLIREVGDAGRIHGKPVGICGEAAADPLLAVVLVGLGATSLSMAPTALADVRASLLQHSLDDARVIAEAALAANGAASAREAAAQPPPPMRPRTRPCSPDQQKETHSNDNDVYAHRGWEQGASRSPALRHVPVRHDHAEHPRAHRVGHLHRVLHRGRVDAQRRPRDDRRPVHPLPAADHHRLHRRHTSSTASAAASSAVDRP